MPRYPQPFRGQARPKVRGYPSPPRPIHRTIDAIFWFVFTIVGIGIFYFAITSVIGSNNFGGIAVFIVYLIFLFIAIFAYRDARRIKTITSDQDMQEDNDQQDTSFSSAGENDDRFIEVEEAPSNSLHTPWRYRIPGKKFNRETDHRIIGIVLLVCVFAGIGAVFGGSSVITIGLVIVVCVVLLAVYLINN